MGRREHVRWVEGSLSGYLGNDKALLAVRLGGRQVWGEYPWFEAATVGGSSSVRGYDSQRFAGESALYGNAELRLWLGRRKTPILPLRWGLVLLADSGRVWFEGESSDKWHSAYGLGAMVQLIGTPLIFTGGVATGDEGLGFYFKYLCI